MPTAASRRSFLASATAASYSRVPGANDRVQIGFIGTGLIGLRHIADFKQLADVDMTAVCDVYQPRIEYAQAQCGSSPKGYQDFRKLLDDKNVQAVVISTPDHWHALQTIMACAASKDVYVEKPMTLFLKEGRWMTTAARRYNRIACVGTQGRNGSHISEAMQLIRDGVVGKIHAVRFSAYRNIMPGFGRPADCPPPAGLDYDLWLGPAPQRPYNPNRVIYHFRWFWDYSGGQMTNLGAHDMDLVHYLLGARAPKSVYSAGGRYALEDNGETPDTQDAIWEYPGFTVAASIREASGARRGSGGTASSLAGVQLCGTRGVLAVSRGGFELVPDMKIVPESAIPPWSTPPGHPKLSADFKPAPYAEPRRVTGDSPEPMGRHARHFIDCVKSRQRPVADVETGHEVSVSCHLANLSLQLGRRLQWDAVKEEVVSDREANARLVRPYRKPWDDVLRSFKL
ncbi:MAG: Gfo/Idh/MocA family oxidoreductase [Candidatus Solibacter usitatus]|nr:Gfo/Idh/MocA family oxidoreductase [Candidatus Solibacter usitatus]